jgi:hypothetical protein
MPAGKIWKRMIAATAFVGAAIIYFLYNPAQYGFYPFCPLHHFTGLKCPFCGLQQMLHHLLHGQIRAAFLDNPFLFLLLPYIIGWLYLNVSHKKEKRPVLYKTLYGDKTLLILLITGILFAILRNFISKMPCS